MTVYILVDSHGKPIPYQGWRDSSKLYAYSNKRAAQIVAGQVGATVKAVEL